MKYFKTISIIILLILGFIVRLYKINNPVADWHSFRQADTASVTRLYLQNGVDLLHPKYHDLSNVQSGKENPQGYRMVEFPIYNVMSIGVHKIVTIFKPQTDIDVSSRLTSIIMSILAGLFLFLFIKKKTKNFFISIITLTIYLLLPFNIYYSRTILPESTANFFMILTLYLFDINLLFAGLAFAVAILVKPYTAILAFPLLAYFSIIKLQHKGFKINFLKLVVFSIISLLPFYLWRRWISQFPAGIPASAWLFNGGGIRFRPAWFRWLFFERIGKLILGTYGITALTLGFAYKKNNSQFISLLSAVGILLYFSIIARGNIQHDYYQTLTIPFLSIILAFGFYYLLNFVFKNRLFSWAVTLITFAFMMLFSGYQIKDYYQVNNSNMVKAGQKAQEILPKNSLIVAPYNSDTAFLYQTRFSGWPIEIYDLDKIRQEHPNNPIYLISLTNDNYRHLMEQNHQIIYDSPEFTILDLTHETPKK